jgi:hypothetical protein
LGVSGILLEKLKLLSLIPGKGELVKEIRDSLTRIVNEIKPFKANEHLRNFILQLEIQRPTKQKDPEGQKFIKFGGVKLTRDEFRNRLARLKYHQNDPLLKEKNF